MGIGLPGCRKLAAGQPGSSRSRASRSDAENDAVCGAVFNAVFMAWLQLMSNVISMADDKVPVFPRGKSAFQQEGGVLCALDAQQQTAAQA